MAWIARDKDNDLCIYMSSGTAIHYMPEMIMKPLKEQERGDLISIC